MSAKQAFKSFSQRVGLDIGSHTVKGVEVAERGSEIVIRSAAAVPIPGVRSRTDPPDYGSVIQAIKTLWSSAGFQSKAAAMGLSADSVYLKWLHLEAASPEELDTTARAAAARGAPFPPDDVIVDYRVMTSRGRSGRNVHFVLLVAASARVVDALLNAAESAGLEPIAVDIGAAAALRSIDGYRRPTCALWSGQPLAHCIVGARNTTIAVVRSGELEFARTVPVGGSDFTERIAEHLSVSLSEAEKIKTSPGTRLTENAVIIGSHGGQEIRVPCENVAGRLAREIQRSLRFFASQYAEGSYLGMVGSATISGGGALLKGLDACLEQQGVEISGIVNPFAGYSFDAERGLQHIGDAAPQFETAMGLAIADYWSDRPAQGMEMGFAA